MLLSSIFSRGHRFRFGNARVCLLRLQVGSCAGGGCLILRRDRRTVVEDWRGFVRQLRRQFGLTAESTNTSSSIRGSGLGLVLAEIFYLAAQGVDCFFLLFDEVHRLAESTLQLILLCENVAMLVIEVDILLQFSALSQELLEQLFVTLEFGSVSPKEF
jgi:hypothetical protein